MHWRIGPVVITTQSWLERLVTSIGEGLGRQSLTDAKRMDAVIARQHDLLVQAEADRNVAQAAVLESHELLAEQKKHLDELEAQLATIMRHPVSGPRQEGES